MSLAKLSESLKVNRLLDEANNSVLTGSILQIITELGVKRILLGIIKSPQTNCSEIKQINKIISKQQRKYNAQNKVSSNTSNPSITIDGDTLDNELETNNDVSHFSHLPNECISYICGYLYKHEMKSFKMTSRQIAIVCLEEMQKISIGVLNIHNPFDNMRENDTNNVMHLSQHIQTNRYCKTKVLYSLFEDWESKYNIPQKCQLLFKHNVRAENGNTLSLIDPNTIRFNQIPSKPTQYLIADKRNIIIWNNNKPRLFDETNDNLSINDYKIMILEYFNVFRQKSYIAQIILYKTMNKPSYQSLSQYIQNGFMLTDHEWYNEFKSDMNVMDENVNYLCMYGHDRHYMRPITEHSDLSKHDKVTFHLNKDTDQYPSAKQYYTNQYGLTVVCENNILSLKSCVNQYNSTLSDSQNRLDINFINGKHFRMSSFSLVSRIKHKISQTIFKGIIDPKYIQITNAKNVNFLNNRSIKYKIYLYGTETINHKYRNEYNIRIFSPSNCSYPYCNEKNTIAFSVKYKNQFVVKDFIKYIFDGIKNGNNKFLFPLFKDLMPLLNNINENNCILTPNPSDFAETYVTPFHFNERYVCYEQSKTNFDLFLLNHQISNNNSDTIPLQIKFITNSFISDPIIPPIRETFYENKQYITENELLALDVGAEVYHRDYLGVWCPAEIIEVNGTKVRVHYFGYGSKFDVWCDIRHDFHRFGRLTTKPVTKKEIETGFRVSEKLLYWSGTQWYYGKVNASLKKGGIQWQRGGERNNIIWEHARFRKCETHPYSTHCVRNMHGFKAGDAVWYKSSLRKSVLTNLRWTLCRISTMKSNGSVVVGGYHSHIDNVNEIRKDKPNESVSNPSKYHRNEMINHTKNSNENGIVISHELKRFIGLPLNILINKNETLEEIINKYLIHSKEFILTGYRVKCGRRNHLISISNNQIQSYKPYHEFISEYTNDFILLELKQNYDNLNMQIFPKSIVGGKELICLNEKEMQTIIELLLSDTYFENNLSEKISKRLMEIYSEEQFGWNDIVNDFEDGIKKNDCFGVKYLIEIFAECNIELEEECVWNLLKRCKPM